MESENEQLKNIKLNFNFHKPKAAPNPSSVSSNTLSQVTLKKEVKVSKPVASTVTKSAGNRVVKASSISSLIPPRVTLPPVNRRFQPRTNNDTGRIPIRDLKKVKVISTNSKNSKSSFVPRHSTSILPRKEDLEKEKEVLSLFLKYSARSNCSQENEFIRIISKYSTKGEIDKKIEKDSVKKEVVFGEEIKSYFTKNIKARIFTISTETPATEETTEKKAEISYRNWQEIKKCYDEVRLLKMAIEEEREVEVVKREIVEFEIENLRDCMGTIAKLPECVKEKYEVEDRDVLGTVVADPKSLIEGYESKVREKFGEEFKRKFMVGFRKFGTDLGKLAKSAGLSAIAVAEFYNLNESEFSRS